MVLQMMGLVFEKWQAPYSNHAATPCIFLVEIAAAYLEQVLV